MSSALPSILKLSKKEIPSFYNNTEEEMKKIASIVFLIAGISVSCFGQDLLSKNISLDVNRQRLDNVLEILSNKGDFYFSYNSKIVKKDSLVSLSVRNKTVKETLVLLFN